MATKLEPEALAAAALLATGSVGERRYAAGQPLVVRLDGAWLDARAVEGGRLTLEGGAEAPLVLHPWNHAPRELIHADFEAVRQWHLDTLRAQHAHIHDALSGQKLDTLQQCVAIDVSGGSSNITDAHSLSEWLSAQHMERLTGSARKTPCAALLTAGPAAGKTTMISQVRCRDLSFSPNAAPPHSLTRGERKFKHGR